MHLPVSYWGYLWIVAIAVFALILWRFKSSEEWGELTLGPALLTAGAVLSFLRHVLPFACPTSLIFAVQFAGAGLLVAGGVALGIGFYNKRQGI